MADIIFRLSNEEKKDLKKRVINLNLSIQTYLTNLIRLDKEKNLIQPND